MKKTKDGYEIIQTPYGEVIDKSKIKFEGDYWNEYYDCELCGENHDFYSMSTCERCLRFVCDNCSEAVANRENNPFNYDFLCDDCIKELEGNK